MDPVLPTFDTQDAVPEAFKSLYAEKDGKWMPTVKVGGEDPGLKKKAQDLLDEKKRLEQQYNALKTSLGDTKPEEIAEIVKNHRTAEEERQRKAGEFDKLLEKRVGEVRAELDPLVKEGQEYKTKFLDQQFDIAVREFAAKGGVLAEDMKTVIKIVKDDFIRRDKDGKLVVVDADGDETGQSLEKFFAETFKKSHPKFYAGSGAGGGGSSGGNGGGGGQRAGNGKVLAGDTAAILANLDKIAKGEMGVTFPDR